MYHHWYRKTASWIQTLIHIWKNSPVTDHDNFSNSILKNINKVDRIPQKNWNENQPIERRKEKAKEELG